jgi:hypothetical protein
VGCRSAAQPTIVIDTGWVLLRSEEVIGQAAASDLPTLRHGNPIFFIRAVAE